MQRIEEGQRTCYLKGYDRRGMCNNENISLQSVSKQLLRL